MEQILFQGEAPRFERRQISFLDLIRKQEKEEKEQRRRSAQAILARVKKQSASFIAADGRVYLRLWIGSKGEAAVRDKNGNWKFGDEALAPIIKELQRNEFRLNPDMQQGKTLQQEAARAYRNRQLAPFALLIAPIPISVPPRADGRVK